MLTSSAGVQSYQVLVPGMQLYAVLLHGLSAEILCCNLHDEVWRLENGRVGPHTHVHGKQKDVINSGKLAGLIEVYDAINAPT